MECSGILFFLFKNPGPPQYVQRAHRRGIAELASHSLEMAGKLADQRAVQPSGRRPVFARAQGQGAFNAPAAQLRGGELAQAAFQLASEVRQLELHFQVAVINGPDFP